MLAPSNDQSPDLAAFLATIRTPIVLLDRELPGLTADKLLVDHAPGIRGALESLLASGRTRIGVADTRPSDAGRTCHHRGLGGGDGASRRSFRPGLVAAFDDLDRRAGRDGVDRLLEAGVDAIVSTGTMEHTASVLGRLGERSVRVPNDVSLVVYGYLVPPMREHLGLPTIAYPVEEVATAVRQLLLRRLDQPEAAPSIVLGTYDLRRYRRPRVEARGAAMSSSAIADVEVIPIVTPAVNAADCDGSADTVVVRITDEHGRTGIGEADAPADLIQAFVRAADLHVWSQSPRELLIGADPFELTALYDRLYEATSYPGRRGLGIHALSAIDMALHDLVGKQLDRPVYQLLGGARRECALPLRDDLPRPAAGPLAGGAPRARSPGSCGSRSTSASARSRSRCCSTTSSATASSCARSTTAASSSATTSR